MKVVIKGRGIMAIKERQRRYLDYTEKFLEKHKYD